MLKFSLRQVCHACRLQKPWRSANFSSTSRVFDQTRLENNDMTSMNIENTSDTDTTTVVPEQLPRHFEMEKYRVILEGTGLNSAQSKAILSLIEETVRESQRNLHLRIVDKGEHSQQVVDDKTLLEKTRNSIKSSEQRHFQSAKDDLARVNDQLKRLATDLPASIARVQAGVKLDLNLERGRVKEEALAMEKRIQASEQNIDDSIVGLKGRIGEIQKDLSETIRSFIGGAVLVFLAWKAATMSAERVKNNHREPVKTEVEILADSQAHDWVEEKEATTQ